MKTLQDNIKLLVKTKDGSPCEVWNAGNKIGVLNHDQSTSIPVPNKNEDVIIKGKDITYLDCHSNYLKSLDVQGLTALQSLDCHSNYLKSLDVQGLTALQYLYCSGNHLTSLNVQGLTALQSLYCPYNQLKSLDVQGLTALQSLNCSCNYLKSLDVQGLTALQSLYCSDNQLKSLNVQGLTALQYLYCPDNQLTAQAFKEMFNSLLQTENGSAVVYFDYDDNYKDFTRPPELVEAFNGAKSRGWKFYENNESYDNLI